MTLVNAANQDFTNNSDGYTLGGGITERKLTITGGDVTITGSGSANMYSFPGSSDTLVGRASNDTITGTKTLADGVNVPLGITSGTQIGTAATQKLGFYGANPVPQPVATGDLITALSNVGLRAAGTAVPITTSGVVRFNGVRGSGVTVITTAVSLSLTTSTEYQLANAAAAAFTITMPATTTAGYIFTIKKIDTSANVVSVAATSIDGAATYDLTTPNQFVTLISSTVSGTYYVVGKG